jgi:hypothetical protein
MAESLVRKPVLSGAVLRPGRRAASGSESNATVAPIGGRVRQLLLSGLWLRTNRPRFLCFCLLAAAAAVATACSQPDSQTLDPGPRYEARAWLESNPNPCAFAGNRFDSTEEAVAFVEALYQVGAQEVWITGIYDEDWRIEAEGGPHADTLIIRLPGRGADRHALFRIAGEEAVRFSPEIDKGQEELLLWWD